MTIGITRDGHVTTIELQRPERRNALNEELCNDLRTAVLAAPGEGARVIVLTGQGTSFCAGADLSKHTIASEFPATLIALHRAVMSVEIPVIAAVNGPAVGAGVQLAIAADLRVVAPDAFFAIPAATLGIAVDNWTVKRLASIAGSGVARSILMAADRVDSQQALHCGLANTLGDLARAQDYAQSIAGLAPLSLKHLKLVFNDDGSLDPPTDAQQAAHDAAWSSEDMVEAHAARSEKRPPQFHGR